METYADDIENVLIKADEIESKLVEMGEQITRDYEGRHLLLVGVLKGAFVVMADLSRHIRLPLEFDFMAVSSYGAATKTSGVVRILKDLDHDLKDRDVRNLPYIGTLKPSAYGGRPGTGGASAASQEHAQDRGSRSPARTHRVRQDVRARELVGDLRHGHRWSDVSRRARGLSVSARSVGRDGSRDG